jgi:hypothetical protein
MTPAVTNAESNYVCFGIFLGLYFLQKIRKPKYVNYLSGFKCYSFINITSVVMKFFFSSRQACLAAFEISLALFISGCAIYKTPELPNDQLATIVVADKDRHHALTIESVDGATNLKS